MRTKIVIVVLTVIAMGIAGTVSYKTAAADSDSSPLIPSESYYLAPPIVDLTTTSSTTAPDLVPARTIVRPSLTTQTTVPPTTTTSEVPPRLTAEQEAKIPSVIADIIPSAGEIDPSVPSTDAQIQWCIDTRQDLGNCKFPESENMSDENATDYDLPN